MSQILVTIRKAQGDLVSNRPKVATSKPTPGQVLYAPPNQDGSEKACGNCYKFCRQDQRCLEVDGPITVEMVCGYHVFGEAKTNWVEMGQTFVSPDLAGLVSTPASCGKCKHSYEADRSLRCSAVSSPAGGDAVIEALGCCVLWSVG
jgi:hypothetical protein